VQVSAVGGINDSKHGLYLDTAATAVTVFQGDTYTTRDVAQDFLVDLSGGATLSSDFGTEIVFNKITGIPSSTGTVTISSNNRTTGITINEEGLID